MSSTGFHNRISYHDYEGLSLYEDERSRLLYNLGENRAMILRNHGLLVVGRTVAETFIRLYRLERSCQIQLDASAAGTLNILPGQTATKSGIEKKEKLQIHTPLIKMKKSEIIQAGMDLGVDYSITHSCYDPINKGQPCGRCDACQLRLKGFAEAGTVDPLKYPEIQR